MLQTAIGEKRNPAAVSELIARLRDADVDGTLYVGYPVITSADETVFVEALLASQDHGVVVFHFESRQAVADGANVADDFRDELQFVVYQKLLAFKPLRKGTALSVSVNVITIVPPGTAVSAELPEVVAPDGITEALGRFEPITADQFRYVSAAIQRITTIKPPNRRARVQRADSRGAIMKQIEKEIANLDPWQNRAAIESPAGPQRIRGLAGSGKTIVLALKAAYLHTRRPEWKIGVTFSTRSLYQQFTDLVRRFVFDQTKDEPNWERLQILHAWGGASQPGVYSEMATRNGIQPQPYLYAKQKYGYESAFEGICQELVDALEVNGSEPLFDALLIDEAQDLPKSFFELAYLATCDPKRVVWAYDELQNLTAYSMAPPAELFGLDSHGVSRIPDLPAVGADEPDRDIILPVCYRNTQWALTIAHALGFGVYRETGLVQFFDDPQLWSDIGYEVLSGVMAAGQVVSLARRRDASPAYFAELLTSGDAVTTHLYEDAEDQARSVAASIHQNLTVDELEHRDIMVIVADPLEARTEAGRLMKALKTYGIPSHLVGVTRGVDEFFAEGSIAVSGIYRAKGNEAPMVYVLNSQYGYSGPDLIKRRNILFTAITRSRAWVRLCGTGPQMQALASEAGRVVMHNYHLDFTVPTAEQLEQLRKIHRDRTKAELDTIRQGVAGLTEVVEMILKGELSLAVLPAELRSKIEQLASELSPDDA
jgi:superfamily I DNA and RNA helicase